MDWRHLARPIIVAYGAATAKEPNLSSTSCKLEYSHPRATRRLRDTEEENPNLRSFLFVKVRGRLPDLVAMQPDSPVESRWGGGDVEVRYLRIPIALSIEVSIDLP